MAEEYSPRTTALTVSELGRINQVSDFKKSQVDNKIRKLATLLMDAEKEKRLAARMCQACFYLGGGFAGQAFTEWHCFLCKVPAMHHNTSVPRVCMDCSKGFDLCHTCGGNITMKQRSKYERKRGKKG